VRLIVAVMLLAGCGGDTSSGGGIVRTSSVEQSTAMCSAITGCSRDGTIIYDLGTAQQVEQAYGMKPGDYENAIVIHEQCHIQTVGECPREEERICVEVMRGALRAYPEYLEDVRQTWDQHWQQLPC
jgi:hypothetical protein